MMKKWLVAGLVGATMAVGAGVVTAVTAGGVTPVRAASTASKQVTLKTTGAIAYVPGYGIALRSAPNGPAIPKRKLAHGTNWKIGSAYWDGKTYWYCLGKNQWMDGRYVVLGTVAKDRKVDASVQRNVVRATATTRVYTSAWGTATGQTVKKGVNVVYSSKTVGAGAQMWYCVGVNRWVSGASVREVAPYQNPSAYFQVSYTQIKPVGQVGYNLNTNYEGIKTWLVLKALHLSTARANYTVSVKAAVTRFQRSHRLHATGIVDKATWLKLGYSATSWTSIDSYVAPLQAKWYSSRTEHIEAMIKAAYAYLGKPYIVGASSNPSYGVDCSGLVTQALYAAGINPLPVTSIQHAHPGNEWNCRLLAASKKLKHVSYASRQRGDLIFYSNPANGSVWHVAIYLGNNKVIESWPGRVMVQPIKNSQRSWVTAVARPFL